MRFFEWVALVLVALIGFFVVSVVFNHYQSMGWDLIRPIWRARRNVRKLLKPYCASAKVSSFGMSSIDPQYLFITINVQTDSEKKMLIEMPGLEDSMRHAVVIAGYPLSAVPLIGFSIESQQTVDRDFNGNWFYARK